VIAPSLEIPNGGCVSCGLTESVVFPNFDMKSLQSQPFAAFFDIVLLPGTGLGFRLHH
jgi:hypothetical protein